MEATEEQKKITREFLRVSRRAFDAATKAGKFKLAAEISFHELDTARTIMTNGEETPEALRDLSISLNHVGNTFISLEEIEKGQAYFREGLDIGTRLSKAFPTHKDYKDLKAHFQKKLEESAG